jgi:hypothetical protein
MTALPADQRRQLEKTVREARRVAVLAAQAALARLGVGEPKAPTYLSADEQALRRRLRAHARHLGDGVLASGGHEIRRLSQEVAYEHWHRMLFARYLAENHLLTHPMHGVAVSLDECTEFAKEAGHEDTWLIAASFAAKMLPAIFRPDDAALAVTLAPEYRRRLEALVLGLSPSTFTASDSLGWVYQFWQADEKDRVNDSEVKIGADELPAVTQLFTEPYMVQFLLHNSLGAWWAAKRLTPAQLASATSEQELRDAVALPGYAFAYLRFVREGEAGPWRPAPGTLTEWPRTLQGFSSLDPCCGSGHFLVEILNLMARLRMADEGLSAKDAVDAVLRENLHGLEIDPRCTQIAVFAVALAAWSFPDAGGFRALPPIQVACCGLRPAGSREEWMAVADRAGDAARGEQLRAGMGRLWQAFQQAPVLGSLLDPGQAAAQGDIFTAGWDEVQPLLRSALADQRLFDTDERAEIGVAASGLADAARLLVDRYQLVATNVPYLARSKHHPILAAYAAEHYASAKADLANVFLERCMELASGGVVQVVMPQNWLFLTSYKDQRKRLLTTSSWPLIANLGSGAFSSIGGEVVNVILFSARPNRGNPGAICTISVKEGTNDSHATQLSHNEVETIDQSKQLANPDSRVILSKSRHGVQLSAIATSSHGVGTFDSNRFCRAWHEVCVDGNIWIFQQSSPEKSGFFEGALYALRWENGRGSLFQLMEEKRKSGYTSGKWRAGVSEWGKTGILCAQMGEMPVSFYLGKAFDENASVVIPNKSDNLLGIWSFMSTQEYRDALREIDNSIKVTCGSLVKVPISLDKWNAIAMADFPGGPPKPFTNDPSQWIFHGHPCGSVIWNGQAKRTTNDALRRDATVLQIALARLLRYRWPAEQDEAMELADEQRTWVCRCADLLPMADDDGIVCLPSVRGEAPAADRLRTLVAAAYGTEWSAGVLSDLLTACGHPGMPLEIWLRDHAFKEHCTLFQQRPFIWHIWDGAKDGFSAFVNYHRLDRRGLENLTYTYLGDWIAAQKRDAAAKVPGADLRRSAAEALQARLVQIIEGEQPFDIFVRWKPPHEQPLGWEPDLDDGVRSNIRPFLTAEVLRWQPKIAYTKDRGKDPESAPWFARFKGERINDHHTILAEKQAARAQAGGRKGSS